MFQVTSTLRDCDGRSNLHRHLLGPPRRRLRHYHRHHHREVRIVSPLLVTLSLLLSVGFIGAAFGWWIIGRRLYNGRWD